MIKRKILARALITLLALFVFFVMFSQIPLLSQEEAEAETKPAELFKMSLKELLNVKITTANRTPEKISDIPASVVLITREEIEAYGYRTLAEIIENIPGLFAVDDYGEYGANFGVRGFWSGVPNDNMIILVNGVHQVNDMWSNYPLHKIAVPVEAIDRIEVIRGPMSVVYGNGAFYGVINIFTNDNSDGPLNIAGASAGSEKTKKLFLRTAGKQGDINYVFNASIYDTYGLDKPLADMMLDSSILPSLGVPVDSRTGGMLENNEKYLNFSGTFNEFSLNVSFCDVKKEFYFAFPSTSDGTRDHSNMAILSFAYRKALSNILTLEGKLNYSQSRDWYTYKVLFDDFYGIQELSTNGFEVEVNTFINPSPSLDIKTGLYYRAVLDADDMYDIPSLGSPDLENNYKFLADADNIVTQSLFTQVTYSPFDRLRLTAGIRLEQTPKYKLESIHTVGANPPDYESGVYNQDKIEVIPRLAAIYYLNDQNIFKFLFGKTINRPSFFQNAQNTLDPERDDLKPENIQTFELNYISSLSETFTVNASIFHNTLENLITRIVELTPEGKYNSYSGNAGKMVTQGFELTLNAEPIDYLRMELSLTYQKTKDKREGFKDVPVAYSPKLLGYVKAYYHTGNFTMAITGNYVDSMETYWDETKVSLANTAGSRIGEKTRGYFTLGANLRIENLLINGSYLNIRCSNLLDEEIRYPATTLSAFMDRGTLGSGRVFLVSLGYKF
ncbi:MAG: TonB-dependent receptor [Candidatus Aminicenantes bacterium]|nr:TonB-dependent receptor [Candidatus Aminicenantes bacterium]